MITLTKENFEEIVLKSQKPVLIDFWATWCGPCKMIAPVIEEVANTVENVVVCKVDVDQEEELAVKFGIQSIPTLVVMKNGNVINKAVGYRDYDGVCSLLEP